MKKVLLALCLALPMGVNATAQTPPPAGLDQTAPLGGIALTIAAVIGLAYHDTVNNPRQACQMKIVNIPAGPGKNYNMDVTECEAKAKGF